ncbi:hypothetical protein H7347_08965 [Corynebacterium sp. zg-331]|uniref:hypothetical protein n=1 Tax=unclassified Corynebacterium TaxID=2624378 RepID=UPI00128BDDD1|nr:MULTISPECIES: hypothetical protein [unclassified Corynebacterium]MBC3186691.1 hypothetical protein [Corynebacterium sp. zg-331]MPV53173.1 hypothetical protein [Corynebacterium sp. zg331]
MSSGRNRVSEVLRAGREAVRSTGAMIGEFGGHLRQDEAQGRHALRGETVADRLRGAARDVADHRSADSLRAGAGAVADATGEALGLLVDRVGRAAAATRRSGATERAGVAFARVGRTIGDAARGAADFRTPGEAPRDIIDGEVLSETIHEEGTHRD